MAHKAIRIFCGDHRSECEDEINTFLSDHKTENWEVVTLANYKDRYGTEFIVILLARL